MVTIEPMKFRLGGCTTMATTRLMHLDAATESYGARSPTTSTTSSSSSSTAGLLRRCKMHNGFAAVMLSRDLLSPPRATAAAAAAVVMPKAMHRPPIAGGGLKERDLSSSRSPKTSNGGAFDESLRTARNGNVTNHLPISSAVRPPSSPAQYRRLESRRRSSQVAAVSKEEEKDGEGAQQQLPFNAGMTRKTAVTPRACRKAVVTEVRTDQARVVHQIGATASSMANGRSHGLPKFHLNEQPTASANGVSANKCRSLHCKNAGGGAGGDKRDSSLQRLNSHTISSLNKVVKSSMSSSNTSRDTSIESIVPKYKALSGVPSSPKSVAEELAKSSQKRSYNPQMLVRTNKFILNDEKVVSRKTNVIIPRIRSSVKGHQQQQQEEGGGGVTHHIPIYRDLEEKVMTVKPASKSAFNPLNMKENKRPTNGGAGGGGGGADQVVPGQTTVTKSLWSRQLFDRPHHHQQQQRRLYDDCDTDFHKDPSNESLYIDFSKKRSPVRQQQKELDMDLSPLRPINKDALLQRGDVTCEYMYQFEKKNEKLVESSRRTTTAATANRVAPRNGPEPQKMLPSVFYVSCASWMPKCNNKFSLRERRLLEESKTISRKR